MAFHKLAVKSFLLAAAAIATTTTTQAFVPTSLHNQYHTRKTITSSASASSRTSVSHVLNMVATTPADLGMDVDNNGNMLSGPLSGGNNNNKGDGNGAMMDLKGIVFSVSHCVGLLNRQTMSSFVIPSYYSTSSHPLLFFILFVILTFFHKNTFL